MVRKLSALERGDKLFGGPVKFTFFVAIHDRQGWFGFQDLVADGVKVSVPQMSIYLKLLEQLDYVEVDRSGRTYRWRRIDGPLWDEVARILASESSETIPDMPPED